MDDELWRTARPWSDCGLGCGMGFRRAESTELAGGARPPGADVGTLGSINSSSLLMAPLRESGLM
jgi:hypothetical protein